MTANEFIQEIIEDITEDIIEFILNHSNDEITMTTLLFGGYVLGLAYNTFFVDSNNTLAKGVNVLIGLQVPYLTYNFYKLGKGMHAFFREARTPNEELVNIKNSPRIGA